MWTFGPVVTLEQTFKGLFEGSDLVLRVGVRHLVVMGKVKGRGWGMHYVNDGLMYRHTNMYMCVCATAYANAFQSITYTFCQFLPESVC